MDRQPAGEIVSVTNVPSSWSHETLCSLLTSATVGGECQLVHYTVRGRAAHALVRMMDRQSAEIAVQCFNNWQPEGSHDLLLVQIVGQPGAEPAMQWQPPEPAISGGALSLAASNPSSTHHSASPSPTSTPALSPAASPVPLQSVCSGSDSLGRASASSLLPAYPQQGAGYKAPHVGPEPWQQQQRQQPQWQGPPLHQRHQMQQDGWSSIYIKNMPEEADKLWLYEKFARFGAVHNVRILVDEDTGKCTGVGYVNYCDGGAAYRAADSMNGVRMGDKLLHVMVQNHPPPISRKQQQQMLQPPPLQRHRSPSWMAGSGRGDRTAAQPPPPPPQQQRPHRQQQQQEPMAQATATMQAFLQSMQQATLGPPPPNTPQESWQ